MRGLLGKGILGGVFFAEGRGKLLEKMSGRAKYDFDWWGIGREGYLLEGYDMEIW